MFPYSDACDFDAAFVLSLVYGGILGASCKGEGVHCVIFMFTFLSTKKDSSQVNLSNTKIKDNLEGNTSEVNDLPF